MRVPVRLLVCAVLACPSPIAAQNGGIVISQIYGGGGNTSATLRNDFIELFNRSDKAVSISGWSVQYASATGSSWDRTLLSGTLQPGQYYLVQEAQGNGGSISLSAPDLSGGINLSATSGKVALVNNTSNLSGTAPSGSQIVDFVGYGAANAAEGSTAPELTNTAAAIRQSAGCTDTNNNRADFQGGSPSPRNSRSQAKPCTPLPGHRCTPIFSGICDERGQFCQWPGCSRRDRHNLRD
jgi:uncharacterized protein